MLTLSQNSDSQLVLASSTRGNALRKEAMAKRLVSRLADLLQREAEAELLEREMGAVDDFRSEAVVMGSRAASAQWVETVCRRRVHFIQKTSFPRARE